jgi:bacterioferritin
MGVLDELRTRLTRELSHAEILAEQVSFLGGRPSTTMTPVVEALDANDALGRTTVSRYASWSVYRERVQQASDLGLLDVAEALRPLVSRLRNMSGTSSSHLADT